MRLRCLIGWHEWGPPRPADRPGWTAQHCRWCTQLVGLRAPVDGFEDSTGHDCDGGAVGGFFPTACGRDFVHPSHPLGRPPRATGSSASGDTAPYPLEVRP